MDTGGLLKIIIIILVIAVVPVGFLFLLGGLAATLAVPVGIFLVVGLGVFFLRDKFTAATKKNKSAYPSSQWAGSSASSFSGAP